MARVLAAATVALAAVGATASTVLAYGTPLPCTSRAESPVFAPWGDRGNYFLVSNGGFENGATNWALTGGAVVVTGNETYHVGGAADSHSLRMPPGSTAESRTLCVSTGEDTLRLFVNNQHVPGSILHVDATAKNLTTGQMGYAAFDVNGDVSSPTWSPTMQLKIPNMFGANYTESLTLLFSLRGTAATWAIDDIYIDPFKSW